MQVHTTQRVVPPTSRRWTQKFDVDGALVQIRRLPIDAVRPSPENASLYHPAQPDDPDIEKMARSIQETGLIEPLILTADHYIISGLGDVDGWQEEDPHVL